MNIPEDDPRLRAAQEAVERDRAKRGARPDVEAGPDYKWVHIPDAAPGQETHLVEVKPEKEAKPEANAAHVFVFIMILGMVVSAFGGPLLDALSSISQNWRHIPTGVKTLVVPEPRPADHRPTPKDAAYTAYRQETHKLLEDLRIEKRKARDFLQEKGTEYGFTKIRTQVNALMEKATAESERLNESDAMKVAAVDRARVLRIFLEDLMK